MLEDYRAGITVDRSHDDADRAAGRRVAYPPWSSGPCATTWNSSTLTRSKVWRPWTRSLHGARIDSGHHLAGDNPDDLVAALLRHLGAT